MIDIRQVTIRYGAIRPLDDASAVLGEGSYALMGPSGSGKSSLLRIIAGVQRPTAGSVVIDGEAVRPPRWNRPVDHRVSLVYQDYRLVEFLSVEENLRLAADARNLSVDQDAVLAALNDVGLDRSYADRAPDTLSGGEQQRVAIARSVIVGSRVLLADEPTGTLDSATSQQVTDVFADVARRPGLTVLVATHDHAVAAGMEHCLVVDNGRLWTEW